MLFRVLLAIALCACSSKRAEPPSRFAIVPDQVLNRLGEFGTGIAIDLRALDPQQLAGFIPDQLGCARDLVKTARMAVLTLAGDLWEGHVTGVDEVATRACITRLAPALGLDARQLDLAWQGDDAVIAQTGKPRRSGEPPVVIQDLLSRVPRTAKAWLVSSGFPQYKIHSAVAYLETTADTWTFTVTAEPLEQGAAGPWLDGIVGAFKTALSAKGAHVEDRWFVVESTPMTAKLVATIPIAALVAR